MTLIWVDLGIGKYLNFWQNKKGQIFVWAATIKLGPSYFVRALSTPDFFFILFSPPFENEWFNDFLLKSSFEVRAHIVCIHGGPKRNLRWHACMYSRWLSISHDESAKKYQFLHDVTM